MSSTKSRALTRSTDQFTEPTAPDYAVPDPKEAWKRLDRLVEQVLGTSKEQSEVSASEKIVFKKSGKVAPVK